MLSKRGDQSSAYVGKDSRRGFFGRTLASVTAAAAAGAALGLARRAPRADASGLNEPFVGANHQYFNEVMIDEYDHVAFFLSVLGAAARPMPTFQNLTAPNITQFAVMSKTFENLGVQAYLGALPYIFNRALAGGAGTIATVEARHASYVNSLFETSLVPFGVAFDDPATQAQVISAVTPFVVSLNGGPPLAFSTTLSASNDIDIANFALTLEFLENQFYSTNVPIYFA